MAVKEVNKQEVEAEYKIKFFDALQSIQVAVKNIGLTETEIETLIKAHYDSEITSSLRISIQRKKRQLVTEAINALNGTYIGTFKKMSPDDVCNMLLLNQDFYEGSNC